MSLATTRIIPLDPAAPAARACLTAYLRLLTDRIPGLEPSHVPDPDPEADFYRPPSGCFLVAVSGQTHLACVALKNAGPGLGEVKRLWVAPEARGQGLAKRMMAAIEEQARQLGMNRLQLDTNSHLPEAIALYRATGWQDVAAFTPFPATHWFAKQL